MSRLTYAVLANEWARPLDGVSRRTTFQEAKAREKEKERGEIEDALKKSSPSTVVDRSRSNNGIDIVVAAGSDGLGNCLRQLPNPSALRDIARRTGMMDTATWTTMEVYMQHVGMTSHSFSLPIRCIRRWDFMAERCG